MAFAYKSLLDYDRDLHIFECSLCGEDTVFTGIDYKEKAKRTKCKCEKVRPVRELTIDGVTRLLAEWLSLYPELSIGGVNARWYDREKYITDEEVLFGFRQKRPMLTIGMFDDRGGDSDEVRGFKAEMRKLPLVEHYLLLALREVVYRVRREEIVPVSSVEGIPYTFEDGVEIREMLECLGEEGALERLIGEGLGRKEGLRIVCSWRSRM
jgi:hypothetical protein